jgi:hypothetical protein
MYMQQTFHFKQLCYYRRKILTLDMNCVYSQIYFKDKIETSVTSSLSSYLFLFVLVYFDRYYFLVTIVFIINVVYMTNRIVTSPRNVYINDIFA